MSPIACPPPPPSSCSLSPCNSLALKAKINCQQLAFWVLAAGHPSAPILPLGSWVQAKSSLDFHSGLWGPREDWGGPGAAGPVCSRDWTLARPRVCGAWVTWRAGMDGPLSLPKVLGSRGRCGAQSGPCERGCGRGLGTFLNTPSQRPALRHLLCCRPLPSFLSEVSFVLLLSTISSLGVPCQGREPLPLPGGEEERTQWACPPGSVDCHSLSLITTAFN